MPIRLVRFGIPACSREAFDLELERIIKKFVPDPHKSDLTGRRVVGFIVEVPESANIDEEEIPAVSPTRQLDFPPIGRTNPVHHVGGQHR